MSRDDRIRLRDLPPVPPVRWPERLSMTLARWLNRCPRAGYLYVKTGGGAPSPQMDRGSLAHEGFARIMVDWIQAKEFGYSGRGDEEVSQITATALLEAERDRPELELPHEERDVARLCAFHVALGLDVDPADVVGIERKFVLELECGWTVSGKVDLASMPEPERGQVDDYKTTLHVPPRQEWDPFQQKMYAVFLIWGRPVERVPCPRCEGIGEQTVRQCPECRGRGYVEEAGEPIGGHLLRVTGRELYPRLDPRKRSDGKLARNEHTWTRLELLEFKEDLERIGERLSERLETWKFPARYSPTWCPECPDEDACPIPRGYRRFAGHLANAEKAEVEEAWAWAQKMKMKVSETERDVKKWSADRAESITVGDTTWEWDVSESRALRKRSGRADWEGLGEAIEGALERGEDFKLADWLETSTSNSFKKQKKPADGVGGSPTTQEEIRGRGSAGRADGRAAGRRAEPTDPDERWGADAPF